jgi:hypothetical protein
LFLKKSNSARLGLIFLLLNTKGGIKNGGINSNTKASPLDT